MQAAIAGHAMTNKMLNPVYLSHNGHGCIVSWFCLASRVCLVTDASLTLFPLLPCHSAPHASLFPVNPVFPSYLSLSPPLREAFVEQTQKHVKHTQRKITHVRRAYEKTTKHIRQDHDPNMTRIRNSYEQQTKRPRHAYDKRMNKYSTNIRKSNTDHTKHIRTAYKQHRNTTATW